MKAQDINLQELLQFRPGEGKLLLSDSRMLLFSQASLAILQKLLAHHFGQEYMRALFSQFGQRCGLDDYQAIAENGDWDSDMDRIASGPVTHMWEGIAHVEPTLLEFSRETQHFLMKGIWRNSYEAENYLKNFGRSEQAVCFSLTGYASGWASAFFHQELLAIETSCLARGDESCTFEIRPIGKWGEEANPWIQAIHATTESISSVLEAKVAHRTRDLLDLNLKLDEAKKRAEEANLAKSQFLAKVSHELRTPMNGVIGLTEILKSHSLTPEQRDIVEMILQAGTQQIAIISDLLDFSKLEAGKMTTEKASFSPRLLLQSLEKNFSQLCRQKSLVFDLEVSQDLPEDLWGDSFKINQILLNLLSNALKFTKKGFIRLQARRENQKLIFIIEDSGIGIASDDLSKLFQPFQQADSSISRQFGGTGLGLTICLELAKLLSGELQIQSTLGIGTRVSLSLPLELAPKTSSIPSSPLKVIDPTIGKHRKVLVAEDNAVNSLVIVGLLKAFSCEVELVENGVNAIQAFQNGRFDLVLLDFHMPELDGISAASEIRAWEAKQSRLATPIYILSADTLEDSKELAFSQKVNGYLSKPLRKQELALLLQEVFVTPLAS